MSFSQGWDTGFRVILIYVGIVFVWLVVRWSNRRDDPLHAKRPPDAP